jgi:L-iditol 2-dehydrogenase
MNLKRKFVTWNGLKNIEINSGDVPTPGDNEIILKVKACSVCGSDIRTFNNGNNRVKPGQIIGHEIAGEVFQVGKKIKEFHIGDRLSLGADVPCNNCVFCLNGNPNSCETNYAIGHQFEGGFSEYMLINELTLKGGPVQKINNDIKYPVASLSEPLACCINGFENSNFSINKTVGIFGAGPIGLILAKLFEINNAKKIFLFDLNRDRLKLAKKNIRNVEVFEVSKELPNSVLTKNSNNKLDIIFTACPSIEAQRMAIEMINKRGLINFFGGLPKNSSNLTIDSNFLHYSEVILTGSHGSTPEHHRKATEMLNNKDIDLEFLIGKEYSLDDIKVAFRDVEDGKCIKAVICP